MNLETFLSLPTEAVAQLVRQMGPKVCVFPVNGTRRWFMLEYPDQTEADFLAAFFRAVGQRYIEICRIFFDHGIDTLLTPIFGPDLLGRGEEYSPIVAQGLSWFAQDQRFLDFYVESETRVRVYGDARRYFQGTPYAYALDLFDRVTRDTAAHQRHRLFFGVCAHDATENVAEIAVRFYQEHGRLPGRRQIVEAYYGEYVAPVDIFIGFDRPAAFDMPLLATGAEDLYFTVSPSLHLDAHTLRAILYDHMYARRVDEASYSDLSAEDWQALAEFYALNRHNVLGLGQRYITDRFWYPLPQVHLPPSMASALPPKEWRKAK